MALKTFSASWQDLTMISPSIDTVMQQWLVNDANVAGPSALGLAVKSVQKAIEVSAGDNVEFRLTLINTNGETVSAKTVVATVPAPPPVIPIDLTQVN